MAESRQTYALGDSGPEAVRLARQARALSQQLMRFLEDADIEEGMKVLDVGSGAGDVAFALAEKVGPSGSVVGVELNQSSIEAARKRAADLGHGNVAFVQADLTAQQLPVKTDFDAVVGRLVLMYLPEPVGVLNQLMGHVKSGGVLAFIENDDRISDFQEPAAPTLAKLRTWIRQGMTASGADMHFGMKLPRLFVDLGLKEIGTRAEIVAGLMNSERPPSAMVRHGRFPSILPRLLEEGILKPEESNIEELARQADEELSNGPYADFGIGTVLAWGRKP